MKTVALVDWNWMGHHPTYFQHMIQGFRRIGCRVAAFCPKHAVEEVKASVGSDPEVTINTCKYVSPRKRLPAFIRGREHAWRTFGNLGRKLERWEEQHGLKIDLVFFQTIYDSEFENIRFASRAFQYPWSGLYLHARAFRMPGTLSPGFNHLPCPGNVINHPGISSICMLDEGVLDNMRELLVGKQVIAFPDITDEAIDEDVDGYNLSKKLLDFANGKKIVACMGHLQKTKGLLEVCHAACDPACAGICFFFGGEVNWNGLSLDETRLIRRTLEKQPNVFTHLTRIDSDSSMNAVIKVSDVVFAAYTNFPNSSNIMTKAAMLKRPIIVSDGHLMAERVRRYTLGRVVPEGSVRDIITEILFLCERGSDINANYKAYYAMHSPESFEKALKKVIKSISDN